MDLEQLYEIAAKELEANAPRKGLYARAFSEAMGDVAKAKAIYIRLRVEQLEDTLRRQAEEQQRIERQARINELRAQREQIVASLKTWSDCQEHLSHHGYRVRESWWEPGRWEISGGPRGTRVIHDLKLLQEFTREVLLSGLDPDPKNVVSPASAPNPKPPAAGDASGAAQPSKSEGIPQSEDIDTGRVQPGRLALAAPVDVAGSDPSGRTAHGGAGISGSVETGATKWALRVISILGVLLFMAISQGFGGALGGLIKGVLIFTFLGWVWRATDRLGENEKAR